MLKNGGAGVTACGRLIDSPAGPAFMWIGFDYVAKQAQLMYLRAADRDGVSWLPPETLTTTRRGARSTMTWRSSAAGR